MPKRRLTTGEVGWAGLTAYVLIVDSIAWVTGNETMSVSFGKWLQKPRSRRVTGAAWTIVTMHLFFSFPLPGEKTVKKVVLRCFTK